MVLLRWARSRVAVQSIERISVMASHRTSGVTYVSDDLRPALRSRLVVGVFDQVSSCVGRVSKIVEVIEDRRACCHNGGQGEEENDDLHVVALSINCS